MENLQMQPRHTITIIQRKRGEMPPQSHNDCENHRRYPIGWRPAEDPEGWVGKQISILPKDANAVFFFPAWKPKVCVKRFFGLFLSFFTHKKSLSRTLFCKFSRTARIFHGHFLWFFHAWILCFHGENLDIFRNFHVWVSFFSRVKNEEFGF